MSKFIDLFKSDIKRYNHKMPFYQFRFHYWLRRAQTSNGIFKIIPTIMFYLVSKKNGNEMNVNTIIGKGFSIIHAYNITVNKKSIIGDNCCFHKNTVIGQQSRGDKKGCPTLGNKVWVGINAVIVGKVNIGDDVLIAANSFVNVDVPSHSVVFGNPCVIKHKDNATEGYIKDYE